MHNLHHLAILPGRNGWFRVVVMISEWVKLKWSKLKSIAINSYNILIKYILIYILQIKEWKQTDEHYKNAWIQ